MAPAEVRTRCTNTGQVEIGRLPGVVRLTMLAPLAARDAVVLGTVARQQYGL